MTFWFSEKVRRIWTCVAITPDYNHVAYHDVLILRDKDFLKMTHFWVPQNSSIPREVSLETVHFLFIFLKIGPFLGPSKRFLPSWSVVRNGPKSGSFCSKRVHFWTVSNDTSRGMEPFWVTQNGTFFGKIYEKWTVSNDTSRGMELFWGTQKLSIFGKSLSQRIETS